MTTKKSNDARVKKCVRDMIEKSDYSLQRIFYIAGACFEEMGDQILCVKTNMALTVLWRKEFVRIFEAQGGGDQIRDDEKGSLKSLGITIMVGATVMIVHGFRSADPNLQAAAMGSFAAILEANRIIGVDFKDGCLSEDPTKFSESLFENFKLGLLGTVPEWN